ncbi:hypothetical protein K491DRAFT_692165 [Lophiostoma macrostomum CBS 122681]|uniref:Uncharacterized protein n=1 Tax=Lophiostoma macrostomum CBS 122681 TaxID=1314788 RepID=A0A6A6TAI1_9PLEO|nr:hypothetical protein K491DRAFT_692165 [Lophiostoma macrostomum CBS 122681]
MGVILIARVSPQHDFGYRTALLRAWSSAWRFWVCWFRRPYSHSVRQRIGKFYTQQYQRVLIFQSISISIFFSCVYTSNPPLIGSFARDYRRPLIIPHCSGSRYSAHMLGSWLPETTPAAPQFGLRNFFEPFLPIARSANTRFSAPGGLGPSVAGARLITPLRNITLFRSSEARNM